MCALHTLRDTVVLYDTRCRSVANGGEPAAHKRLYEQPRIRGQAALVQTLSHVEA